MCRRRWRGVWLSAAVVLAACATVDPDDRTSRAVQATAPGPAKADSPDDADRSCRVVLRDVGRQPGSNGYHTECTGGVCSWVWEGSVDVASDTIGQDAAATVHVLYRRAGDQTWWQVSATPASHSPPGFVRHVFAVHEHLPGPSTPPDDLAAAAVELIPFLQLANGTRLFDHNRRPGSLDNYVLDQGNHFAVGDGSACAPVVGRISLFGNWDEHQSGIVRQGGYLALSYDLGRLPKCRGIKDGQPAWDTVAHVRFLPSGQHVSGSVANLPLGQGSGSSPPQVGELVTQVPADATEAQLWFRNYSDDGTGCETWDSNYGKNYRYAVWPAATDPRCDGIERWTKRNSDVPYITEPHCLSYRVERQHAADHCELHVSGVGHGHVSHYGIPADWLEAYISVAPQQGQLLGAGMLVIYRDQQTSLPNRRFIFARPVGPSTWQTGFVFRQAGVMGANGVQYDVEQLAFFIDVQRPSGEVVRLWQSRHGANYRWSDAFTLPPHQKPIPYGSVRYSAAGSAIFDARRTCTQ